MVCLTWEGGGGGGTPLPHRPGKGHANTNASQTHRKQTAPQRRQNGQNPPQKLNLWPVAGPPAPATLKSSGSASQRNDLRVAGARGRPGPGDRPKAQLPTFRP
eukprot:15452101-Alexandrium_andersonii.AAC.1